MNLKLPAGDFRAYLFDCDGTIADSMPLHYKAWRRALARSEETSLRSSLDMRDIAPPEAIPMVPPVPRNRARRF